MNEEYQVTLPKLGESILSATVVQWFKKEGEQVQRDEPLLEVSTDKVNSEIPSPVSGVLLKIHAKEEQEIAVGAPLATLSLVEAKESAPEAGIKPAATHPVGVAEHQDFLSPVVLRLAKEKGIPLSELEKIPGTGQGGRITKRDVEAYLEKPRKPAPCPLSSSGSATPIERVKMSSMRKAIAENMVKSFYEAPHAALLTEIDVTQVLKRIQEKKEAFFTKNGAKLTITSFVARAVSKALQEFPLLNSSLEGDTIVLKKFINLGFAVNIKEGLMVPVLKNCEQKNLTEIAVGLHELSTKARSGQLSANDVKEGSMTITNFGMTGILMGIPIIRHPEVAILGVGAVHKKVVVVEEDNMAIRCIANVSLTFDHRVLDGIYGCEFLASLKHHLETDLSI